MKVTEMFEQSPYANWLLYGQPGCGKTTYGALCPDPLILLTEHHGKASIMAANPNAEVVLVDSYAHFLAIMRSLKAGHTDGRMFTFEVEHIAPKAMTETLSVRTLVIDSISNIHELASRYYPTDSANPKVGGKAWQDVQRDLRAMMHDLRSLPVNMVSLALVNQTVGEDKVVKVMPNLFGKASVNIGQYFDGLGFMFRRGEGRHSIGWSLPNTYITKSIPDPHDRCPFTVNFSKRGEGATLGTIMMALYDLPAELVGAEWDSADQLTWEPGEAENRSDSL